MSGAPRMAVLCGGWSAEREVSLESGRNAHAALCRSGIEAELIDADRDVVRQVRAHNCDTAFIALHGTAGEDGTVQAALELASIRYTGTGVLGSALAMSKWHSKLIWQAAGLPTPAFERVGRDSDWAAVAGRLGLPLFIKPSAQGSSIGVTRVTRIEDLPRAWERAAEQDRVVLAERLVPGAEHSITYLDGQMLPAVQIIPPGEFYDYEAKYLSDETRYLCPAPLSDEQSAAAARIGKQAFELLGCSSWGRVDFMLDGDGGLQLIEVNTVPGLTTHSLAPMSAQAAGLDFDAFILRIAATAGVRP